MARTVVSRHVRVCRWGGRDNAEGRSPASGARNPHRGVNLRYPSLYRRARQQEPILGDGGTAGCICNQVDS
jgi:hypothetical protein